MRMKVRTTARKSRPSHGGPAAECAQCFDDVVEMSGEIYWARDEGGRFTFISGRNLEQSGIDAKQALGAMSWGCYAAPADDGGWEAHHAVLAARQPFTDFVFQLVNLKGGCATSARADSRSSTRRSTSAVIAARRGTSLSRYRSIYGSRSSKQ
jgi:hypothetical protein